LGKSISVFIKNVYDLSPESGYCFSREMSVIF
jgi:hypothetical protein